MAKELKRILYIEDEADIRTIAVTVLESLGGFTVITCDCGQKAIDIAPSANADLILLDVMMPGMDGPTTLERLRGIAQTAATPVVFMTAKVQAAEIQHFKSLGALDVIPKPFDPMTLSQQVLKIWERGAGTAAPAPQAQSRRAPDQGLQELIAAYAADLPGTLSEIETLWGQLAAGSPQALKTLHRTLHSLAGSAGTFGYSALGKNARAFELALAPYLPEAVPPADKIEGLCALLEALKGTAKGPDTPL